MVDRITILTDKEKRPITRAKKNAEFVHLQAQIFSGRKLWRLP
jgi:hypothetical protein